MNRVATDLTSDRALRAPQELSLTLIRGIPGRHSWWCCCCQTANHDDDVEEDLRAVFRMVEALLDGMEESVRNSWGDNLWTYVSFPTYMRQYKRSRTKGCIH